MLCVQSSRQKHQCDDYKRSAHRLGATCRIPPARVIQQQGYRSETGDQPPTVECYFSRTLLETGCNNRLELTLWMLTMGSMPA